MLNTKTDFSSNATTKAYSQCCLVVVDPPDTLITQELAGYLGPNSFVLKPEQSTS